MKSKQGSFTQRAVLAGLIAGSGILAASAYAVSAENAAGTPRCEARHQQQGAARWEDRRAAHRAELKERLALTADQEAAWNTFTESAQPGPRHPGIDRKAMREEFEKLRTPERLDRMQAMSDMRRVRMAERAGAIKTFYAQLSPEQQRVFDAEAMPRHHRHGHRHQHRHQS